MIVIKTMHLDRMVQRHLLYREGGGGHEHVWVGEVGRRAGKVPPMSRQLLPEPFWGGKCQRWRESAL